VTPRFRPCVECPKCHTRYIIGVIPYRNGSYVSAYPPDDIDLRRLYCSCLNRFDYYPFKLSELKIYTVSEWAYARGYGSLEEIVLTADEGRQTS
jgi:hypothetical protein